MVIALVPKTRNPKGFVGSNPTRVAKYGAVAQWWSSGLEHHQPERVCRFESCLRRQTPNIHPIGYESFTVYRQYTRKGIAMAGYAKGYKRAVC